MAEICSTIEAASKSKRMDGIIGVTREEAVSMDFRLRIDYITFFINCNIFAILFMT